MMQYYEQITAVICSFAQQFKLGPCPSLQLIRQESLPADFHLTVDAYYRPIARRIADWHTGLPIFVGINGGQGTANQPWRHSCAISFRYDHDLSAAVISIDDLYLTRSERSTLAANVHPLLATRGVPGTHDPVLGLQVIHALMEDDHKTAIPRFAKGIDERLAVAEWPIFSGRADVVILEGWCVGAPQPIDELKDPINTLEQVEDPDGRWRHYVNDQLAGPYRPLFDRLDHIIMLRAPSMACIRSWAWRARSKATSTARQLVVLWIN